jgi:hypothetical protein
MELNNTAFASVFTASVTHSHSADRTSAQLIMPAINAGVLVKAPESAIHFRLVGSLGLVPDFVFDDELMAYAPTEPELVGKSVITNGTLMTVNDAAIAGNTIDLQLDLATIPSEVSVVLCLGIEFVQKIGDVEYLVSQNRALKVVDVF